MHGLTLSLRPAVLATLVLAIALAPVALAGTTSRTWPAKLPPWYRGEAPAATRVGVLPVMVDAGPVHVPSSWLPREELSALAGDITGRLAAMPALTVVDAAALSNAKDAPGVSVGCVLEEADFGECVAEPRQMVLTVTSPSKAWRERAARVMADANVDLLVVPVLSVRSHWLRQADWKGRKEIPLGTGHAQPAPWLTSLETPVDVVQLGAVVISADGKVQRSGVEGLLGVRTEFAASALRAQRMLRDADVAELRTTRRREDLRDQPLVWEAATDALIRGLIGR